MCFSDRRQFGTHAGAPMSVLPVGRPMNLLPFGPDMPMGGAPAGASRRQLPLVMPPLGKPMSGAPFGRAEGPMSPEEGWREHMAASVMPRPEPLVAKQGPMLDRTDLTQEQLSGYAMAAFQGYQPAIDILRQHGWRISTKADGALERTQ